MVYQFISTFVISPLCQTANLNIMIMQIANIMDMKTKRNETKRNKTKQNKTKQNKTKQNKTKRNETKRGKSFFFCLDSIIEGNKQR